LEHQVSSFRARLGVREGACLVEAPVNGARVRTGPPSPTLRSAADPGKHFSGSSEESEPTTNERRERIERPPGSRGEFPPPAPTEPDVTVSRHPARAVLTARARAPVAS